MSDRYLGKFEGVVVDNDDPSGLCRLDVRVSVLTHPTGWCLPALPYAGKGVGLALVPPIGAKVWIEWPGGDLRRPPIWSGAYWAPGDDGVAGAGPGTIRLVTPGGHAIEVSDDDGSITLTSSGGASITIGKDAITLDNGQGATVELSGSSVALNGQSFSVG